jgi:hypothetical protein
MPTGAIPRRLTLPSGARVVLRPRMGGPRAVEPPEGGAPIFSDAIELFDREVKLERDKRECDVRDLMLADFHVLRAVATKAGLLHEDEVEVACHNCGERLVARPCEQLEIGPYVDGELDDPELDRTAELGVPLEIAPVPLGRVRQARTVTLEPRTVREAMPLFAALGKKELDIDADVVRAMGIRELGPVSDPHRIARALMECDDDALSSVTNAFLEAHYPLRLGADLFCPKCKARNTIDAPELREFHRSAPSRPPVPDGADARPLPPLEEFVEIAHAMAEPLIAEIPGEKVEFVVEGGVPAVDDGGEPLLGSYVPPPPAGALVPTRPPTVTVYYRTFEAIAREGGPFDWEAELRETIEHELEHHLYFLRGHDPMDEEEHAEIDREAVRVVGRREATRRTVASFGASIKEFFTRAWPLVLVGAAVLAISIAESRCAGP